MYEDGYINDYGKLETVGGRYPNLYGLNPESGYFIGVEIKRNTINIGIINFKGDVMELNMDIPYASENSITGLNNLCQLILGFINKLKINKENILDIHINISGRVNPRLGLQFQSVQFRRETSDRNSRGKAGI